MRYSACWAHAGIFSSTTIPMRKNGIVSSRVTQPEAEQHPADLHPQDPVRPAVAEGPQVRVGAAARRQLAAITRRITT